MPQALKVALLIQFLSWVIPHFPLLGLWSKDSILISFWVTKTRDLNPSSQNHADYESSLLTTKPEEESSLHFDKKLKNRLSEAVLSPKMK